MCLSNSQHFLHCNVLEGMFWKFPHYSAACNVDRHSIVYVHGIDTALQILYSIYAERVQRFKD